MATTYDPLITTTLTSTQSSVTFDISSTPNQSYTDLIIVFSGSMSAADNNNVQFNDDTGSSYSVTRLYGNGSTYGTNLSSTQNQIQLSEGSTTAIDLIQIFNYTNTHATKTVISRGSSVGGFTKISVGLWRSTAAITKIKLFPGGTTYAVGSSFTIYGIKAA